MAKTDGIAGVNVYVPEAIYTKFKIKCIKEKKTVKSVLIDFMIAYSEEEENGEDQGDSKEAKDS